MFNKKKIINIISFIAIMINFYNYHMFNRSNISLYLLFFLLLFFFIKTDDIKPDKIINSFALVFTIFFTFGDSSVIKLSRAIYIVTGLIGWFALFQRLFYLLKISINKINVNEKTTKKEKISKRKFILISMLIGFLCYLPYFLKFFPALMSSDGYNQLLQIKHIIGYSNHHPLAHTFLMKFWYSIGYGIFKKDIIGLAFYTVFQMLFLSFIYSYVVYILYKNNIKKIWIILLWMFYFLYPFNALYSITIWKDIIFAPLLLLFSVYIWDHYNEKEEWDKKNKIIFIVFGILLCIFRSNALLAFLIFVFSLYKLYNNDFKKLFKSIILIVIVALLIKGPFVKLINGIQPDFVESLSIPLQQVAYVIRNDGRISKSEMKKIKKIADVDLIKEQNEIPRAQFVSDYVKDNIRANDKTHYLEKHKFDYLKLWLSLGVKNPNKYIRAWINQTNGFWYYNVDPYIVYLLSTQTYGREGYDLGFEQQDYLPPVLSKGISKLIEYTTNIYYNVCSPAIGLYFVLVSLFILLEKKKNILHCIFPIAIVLTLLIATPVSCEFRYVYTLFLGGGAFLLLSLSNKINNRRKTKKKILN